MTTVRPRSLNNILLKTRFGPYKNGQIPNIYELPDLPPL